MINVRDFDFLSLELKDVVEFLKKCRINEENKGLFSSLDNAINIGSSHMKVLSGFKELEMKNVDIEKYHVVINKHCKVVEEYVSEIKRIKQLAL